MIHKTILNGGDTHCKNLLNYGRQAIIELNSKTLGIHKCSFGSNTTFDKTVLFINAAILIKGILINYNLLPCVICD